ncbi:MAG: M23 family metallopeptidase [Alphaproteobacteria bacterium]|nr:M23 family metallopeptidase [Alphaproteobacteria bacterium]
MTDKKVCFEMLRKLSFCFIVMLLVASGFSNAHANERTHLEGQFIQGGMILGTTEVDAKVVFQDRLLPLTDDGKFVFGFHRDSPDKDQLKITYADGHEEVIDLTIKQREYKIQRIDGLPPKKVTPPEEVLARIRDDNAQVAKARAHITDEAWYLETFIWPSKGPISGVYGSQRILNGQPRQPHYGIDIAAPVGTPVYAPASGIIRLAHPDMYYSGGTLFLDHGHGLMSAFLHLDKIHVKEGQFVKQGDLVADIGKTGRVTGAHLDWRINWHNNRLDPAFFVPPMDE